MHRLLLIVTLTLGAGGFACSEDKKDGPPCERLAAALCDDGDVQTCEDFIASETTQRDGDAMSEKEAAEWCASIVEDPSAVKVFRGSAEDWAAKQ